MRVLLRTMVKRYSRRWAEQSFDSVEAALLHWLTLPHSRRHGALVHEEGMPTFRKPRDNEVPLGNLLSTEFLAQQFRYRFTTSPQEPDFKSNYPRVKDIMIAGRTFHERDVIDAGTARDTLRLVAAEQARLRPLGPSSAGKAAPSPPPPPKPDPDVVDAEWRELPDEPGAQAGPDPRTKPLADQGERPPESPASPHAADAPSPARDDGPSAVDARAYRGALVICTELSPASGRPYRAVCDEAFERLEEFLSRPMPGTARKAARTAHALLHALPRHFPSADAAGRWAMVARPAIGAFAEAAYGWLAPAPLPLPAPPPAPVEERAPGPEPKAQPPAAEGAASAGASADADAPAPAEPPPAVAGVPAPKARTVRSAPRKARGPQPKAAPGTVATPAPAPEPASVPEEPPSPPAEPVAEPSARRPLTPTERRVLGAMNPKVSMRKHEIAIMVGIGRGSCNRIIDRLVSEGICRETMPLRYVIVQEASA
jgi:hypothetical protein